MIKRILVGLAGTNYTPVAIRYAVELAQRHQAELTGVTVLNARAIRLQGVGLTQVPGIESVRDQRSRIAREQVDAAKQAFQAACDAAHIKHALVEEAGDPFTALIDLARYHDALVFGLRSVFEYDFQAGDAESLLIRLVGSGARPLIAVPNKYRPIHRAMIAYNGSMESAKAMKRFIQMRLWPNVQVRLVAFDPSEERAYRWLLDAEGYCRAHRFSPEHQALSGDPRSLLLAAAALWQADLIVMGNSARSVLSRRVLGDTLLSSLRHAEIPLFLAQ